MSNGFCWLAFCQWFHMQIEKVFAVLSRAIATYPKITILVGILSVACFSVGFAWFNPENRTVKLFIPQNSQSMKDLNRAEKHFQLKMREEVIILVPKSPNNLLSPKCFAEAFRLHQAIINIPYYSTFCATLNGMKANSTSACAFMNPLELFNFDEKKFVNISSVLVKASDCSQTTGMSNGRPFCQNINRMFGSQTRNSTRNIILNAEAIRMVYYLRDAETDADYNKIISWENEFISILSSVQENMTCAYISYAAERSLDDAIASSSTSDIRYNAIICFDSVLLRKLAFYS